MSPKIPPVTPSAAFPATTSVVIIGGGIVGLTAALTLAERNIPVVVLEKGRIAGEQSSRNLGWIRKTSRAADDIPLAQAADRLWAGMAARVGCDVGYRQAGIMFIARNDAQMALHESWFKAVAPLALDTRLLSKAEIATRVPGGQGHWTGGFSRPPMVGRNRRWLPAPLPKRLSRAGRSLLSSARCERWKPATARSVG